MAQLYALFESASEGLQKSLQAAQSPQQTAEILSVFFDHLQAGYIAQESDTKRRALAADLLPLAKKSALSVAHMSETRIYMELPSAPQSRATAQIGRFLPAIFSAITMGILFALDYAPLAFLPMAAAILCVLQISRQPQTSLPPAQADVLPQAHALCNAVGDTLHMLDGIIDKQSALDESRRSEIVWTQPQLAALQTLWEAAHTQDGEYALKALPSLLHALEQQEMRILEFSPENSKYFENVPGAKPGITIRPALLQAKKLLARGQVTA